MKYELPDIFLHFLEKDTQDIYGLRESAFDTPNVQMALNIAALLCKEHCILPLGAYLESEITKSAILNNIEYVKEGLVVFAMREYEIQEFIEKKQEQFKEFMKDVVYRCYFDVNSVKELTRNHIIPIHRNTKIGNYCLQRWDEILTEFVENYSGDLADLYTTNIDTNKSSAAMVAKALKDKAKELEGSAFIWGKLQPVIDKYPKRDPFFIYILRRVFQRDYFSAYLVEYRASILFDIYPLERQGDFFLKKEFRSASNFKWFDAYMKCLQLEDIFSCKADQILRIKHLPEFVRLLQIYLSICNSEAFTHTLDSIREEVTRLYMPKNSELRGLADIVYAEVFNGKKRRRSSAEMGGTTNTFNFNGPTEIKGSTLGTVEGDMIVTFSESDIANINKQIKDVVEAATTHNIEEKDEIIAKMDELKNEVACAKPNKKKIYEIVDWTHKISAISVAVINLYRVVAPFVGLPII